MPQPGCCATATRLCCSEGCTVAALYTVNWFTHIRWLRVNLFSHAIPVLDRVAVVVVACSDVASSRDFNRHPATARSGARAISRASHIVANWAPRTLLQTPKRAQHLLSHWKARFGFRFSHPAQIFIRPEAHAPDFEAAAQRHSRVDLHAICEAILYSN